MSSFICELGKNIAPDICENEMLLSPDIDLFNKNEIGNVYISSDTVNEQIVKNNITKPITQHNIQDVIINLPKQDKKVRFIDKNTIIPTKNNINPQQNSKPTPTPDIAHQIVHKNPINNDNKNIFEYIPKETCIFFIVLCVICIAYYFYISTKKRNIKKNKK